MTDSENPPMIGHVGPIEIDWPRALGYYAGIGAAVVFGVLEPPVGIFIAAVPLFKMLNQPGASKPQRIVSEVLQGASKPVGGDSEAAVRLGGNPGGAGGRSRPGWILRGVAGQSRGIWQDAQAIRQGVSTPGG